jgi:hypothetical protein
MNPCEHIRQQALALVALARGERELKEAWEHARTCAGCAQALHQAERILALVDAELAPSPPSAEALLRAKRAVELELDRQPARSLRAARVAAAVATISAGAALAGPLARHHHHLDASSAALGAGAAMTAAALAWLGVGRRAAGAAFAACVVSLVVAALASGSFGLFAAVGVHCLALEFFTAAWPLAALAAAGGLSSSTSGWTTAALASAGALAGQAALHLTCPERSAAPHLLAFHVGGVMLAAVAGWAVPRALRFVT